NVLVLHLLAIVIMYELKGVAENRFRVGAIKFFSMNKNYLLKIYLSIISLCLWSISSVAQDYNVTTTPQCNNTAGGNEIVNFTGATPTAIGNGTLTAYFRGDL